MKTIFYTLLLLGFAFVSCHKADEVDDVLLRVNLIEETGNEVDDNAGISVRLVSEQESYTGTTSYSGECVFTNLPYGDFIVEL